MKNVSYLILCIALVLGKTNMAAAIPMLNVIDLESTSLARITVTTQPGITNEWSSFVKITESNLKKVNMDGWHSFVDFPFNVVDVDLADEHYETSASVYAGILFWNNGFSNSENWYGAGNDGHPIVLEATSQLDMRFTVKGDGAMIAAGGTKDGVGSFGFSLFDETDDIILFDIATQWSFLSPDLYLADGHTYQLHALSRLGNTGAQRWGEFYWANSPFAIEVPEGSALLLSVPGLFLFLLYRRGRLLKFIHLPAQK